MANYLYRAPISTMYKTSHDGQVVVCSFESDLIEVNEKFGFITGALIADMDAMGGLSECYGVVLAGPRGFSIIRGDRWLTESSMFREKIEGQNYGMGNNDTD